MADFNKIKIDVNNINSENKGQRLGNQIQNPEDLNVLVDGLLYSDSIAQNALDNSLTATNTANVSLTIANEAKDIALAIDGKAQTALDNSQIAIDTIANEVVKIEQFKTDTTTIIDEFKTDTTTIVNEFKTDTTTIIDEFKTNTTTIVDEFKTDTTTRVDELELAISAGGTVVNVDNIPVATLNFTFDPQEQIDDKLSVSGGKIDGQLTIENYYIKKINIPFQDAERFVMPLVSSNNSNKFVDNYFSGNIVSRRNNGLFPPDNLQLAVGKNYDQEEFSWSAQLMNDYGQSYRTITPCTFTYNNVKYFGVAAIAEPNPNTYEFNGNFKNGSMDSNIWSVIKYKNTNTNEIFNSEINSSIELLENSPYVVNTFGQIQENGQRVYSPSNPQASLPLTGGTLTGSLKIDAAQGNGLDVINSANQVRIGTNLANSSIEIGKTTGGVPETPFIDFHTDGTTEDNNSRIIAKTNELHVEALGGLFENGHRVQNWVNIRKRNTDEKLTLFATSDNTNYSIATSRNLKIGDKIAIEVNNGNQNENHKTVFLTLNNTANNSNNTANSIGWCATNNYRDSFIYAFIVDFEQENLIGRFGNVGVIIKNGDVVLTMSQDIYIGNIWYLGNIND